jgi:hypothetical protein
MMAGGPARKVDEFMASQNARAIENAHYLALEMLDILDYASSAANHYHAAINDKPKRDKQGARFVELMLTMRDVSRELGQALRGLGEPFVIPNSPVVQAGDFFAESAHNLVLDMATTLWCEVEWAVADNYEHVDDVIRAVPPPPENLGAKVDLAIKAFRDFPVNFLDVGLLNRLRALCRQECVVAARIPGDTKSRKRRRKTDGERGFPLVCHSPPQVTIDGTPYALTKEGAKLLDALVAANGDWVNGHSVVNQPSRVRDAMPDEVRKVVESAPGKGFRIRSQK